MRFRVRPVREKYGIRIRARISMEVCYGRDD